LVIFALIIGVIWMIKTERPPEYHSDGGYDESIHLRKHIHDDD